MSAWVAKQKVFETPESRSEDPLLSRPRASTESTGILPDINIKRGLQTLLLPKISSLGHCQSRIYRQSLSRKVSMGREVLHRHHPITQPWRTETWHAGINHHRQILRNLRTCRRYPKVFYRNLITWDASQKSEGHQLSTVPQEYHHYDD